jgi:hypothetical protein
MLYFSILLPFMAPFIFFIHAPLFPQNLPLCLIFQCYLPIFFRLHNTRYRKWIQKTKNYSWNKKISKNFLTLTRTRGKIESASNCKHFGGQGMAVAKNPGIGQGKGGGRPKRGPVVGVQVQLTPDMADRLQKQARTEQRPLWQVIESLALQAWGESPAEPLPPEAMALAHEAAAFLASCTDPAKAARILKRAWGQALVLAKHEMGIAWQAQPQHEQSAAQDIEQAQGDGLPPMPTIEQAAPSGAISDYSEAAGQVLEAFNRTWWNTYRGDSRQAAFSNIAAILEKGIAPDALIMAGKAYLEALPSSGQRMGDWLTPDMFFGKSERWKKYCPASTGGGDA